MGWSYLLAAGSLAGLYLVSKQPRTGWAVLAVMETLWVAWSIWTGVYALGLLCTAYLTLYVFNLRKAGNK